MSKRVYEIARERSLETKEVIERLRSAGVEVKNHFAMVDESVYGRVFGDGQSPPATEDYAADEVEREPKAPRPGALLRACAIDLPPGDVVEAVEFERFFRLNLTYGDLQGPVLLNLRASSAEGDGSPEGDAASANGDADAVAEELKLRARTPLPLSDDPAVWERVPRGLPPALAEVAADEDGLDPLQIGPLPLALYMPFLQEWRLDGYTRGRIVNSFSLGPGEEQTVEVFTWDRRTRIVESTTAFESEEVTESSGSRRDAADVSSDVTRQAGFEHTSGGKVGFTVGVVNADLNAGMTARAGVNEAERETRGSIVEATTRSTSRGRTSRTLKVSETTESGREERVTRTLRNANECHTLTVPFFEVLANYLVSTAVRKDDIRLVVLIPSAQLSGLEGFNRQTVRVHETALRLALLDRELEPGFAAARLLDARDRACDILCTGCTCSDDEPAGDGSAEWNAVVATANALADAVKAVRSTLIRFPLSVPEAALGLPPGVQDVQRHLFKKALDTHAPRLLVDVESVGIAGGGGPVSAAQAQQLAQVLATIPAEAQAKLSYDETVSSGVANEIFIYVGTFITGFEPISTAIFIALVNGNTNNLKTYNDGGVLAALTAFRVAYDAWSKLQEAERQRNERLAELARIAREEREQSILSSFGLYETAVAEERLQALLDHLNNRRNIDHYRFAVWNERSAAADESVMALALAGFVDPTPVGIVGDQLAVPVRLDREQRLAAFFAASIADLVENALRTDRRHILPTAALYAESIVGSCRACEPERVEGQSLQSRQLELANQLTELEAARLQARLDVDPPLLDNPNCCPADFKVEIDGAKHHKGADSTYGSDDDAESPASKS